MKMSDETRCKVQYRRASTDLYRRGEPDRDVYVQKREYVQNRGCISNNYCIFEFTKIKLM